MAGVDIIDEGRKLNGHHGVAEIMFSADLAYASRFDEENWGSPPSYLSSRHTMVHPWRRSSDPQALNNDFILIAEFSELEGPRPVITIPKDGAGKFDLSDFAVRIMSIDQNTFVSGGFHMSEDSQVILSDSNKNVFAFVHHFVLFDKQARGYVRPFAVSFVTNDQRKLMTCYEEISAHLRKVARYFKYGNRMMFKNELERYLMDLEYTKAQELPHYRTVMNNTSNNSSEKYEKELLQNLKTLESNISEIKGILTTICGTLNDKRLEHRFARLEEKRIESQKTRSEVGSEDKQIEGAEVESANQSFSSKDERQSYGMMFFKSHNYKPKRIQIGAYRKFDLHLKGLHELCSWGAKEGIQKLRGVYQYFQRDMSQLQLAKREMTYQEPAAGALMFGSNFIATNFMSEIDKVCVGSCCCVQYHRGRFDQTKLLARWSSNDTLESFKSAASSFRSFPDGDDNLSIASISSVSGSYSSYKDTDMRSWRSSDGKDPSSVTDSEQIIYLPNTSSEEQCFQISRPNTQLMVSDPSQTNIPAMPTQQFVLPSSDSDETIVNKLGEVQPSEWEIEGNNLLDSTLTNSGSVGHFKSVCDINTKTHNYTNPYSNQTMDVLLEKNSPVNGVKTQCICPTEESVTNIHERLLCPVHTDEEAVQQFLRTGRLPEDKKNQDFLFNVDEDFTTIAEDDIAYNSRLSVESSGSSSETNSSAQCLWQVFNNYTNMQNIVYSLLSGRPVLVVGSSACEGQVKDVVKALQHFVPRPHKNNGCCQCWSTQLPQISDLSRIKLMGLCRPEKKSLERWLPSSLKKYVSVFDIERRWIHAPVYQGSFLTPLLHKRKTFKQESGAFLSFVRGLVTEISSKSFIFFHLFCLGTAGTFTSGYTLPSQSKSIRHTVLAFLNRLGALDSDAVIVQHLAEVVKHQHLDSQYRILEPSVMPAGSVLLRNQACQTIKC